MWIFLLWLHLLGLVVSCSAYQENIQRILTPPCAAGSISSPSHRYCCHEACGTCGGPGCSSLTEGKHQCCTSQANVSCATGQLPCDKYKPAPPSTTPTAAPTAARTAAPTAARTATPTAAHTGTPTSTSVCPPGGILDDTESYCCARECGQCGGAQCHLYPLGQAPLGEGKCCRTQITASCSSSSSSSEGVLPCALSPQQGPFVPPTARPSAAPVTAQPATAKPSTTAPVTSKPTARPTAEPTARPTAAITAAPTEPETVTAEPTMAPTIAPTMAPTVAASAAPTAPPVYCLTGKLGTGPQKTGRGASRVPENYWDSVSSCTVTACCPASCEKCDTSDTCPASTPDECCVHKIAAGLLVTGSSSAATDVDVSCKTNEPPCIMPPSENPCEEGPCEQGARCGVEYASGSSSGTSSSSSSSCVQQAVCACSEVPGGYSGQFCELSCGRVGGTPCGEGAAGSKSPTQHNTFCCSADEECLRQNSGESGEYSTDCYSKGRPQSCSDCFEDGTTVCINGNSSGTAANAIWSCFCNEGYSGPRCQYGG